MSQHESLIKKYEQIRQSGTPDEDGIVRVNGRSERGRILSYWALDTQERKALAVSEVLFADAARVHAILGVYDFDQAQAWRVGASLAKHRGLIMEGIRYGRQMDETSVQSAFLARLVSPLTVSPPLSQAA